MAIAVPPLHGGVTVRLATRVSCYLAQAPIHHAWLTTPAPLARSVPVVTARWLVPSLVTGPFGATVIAAIQCAVPNPNGRPRILRATLASLSNAAFNSRAANDYVALWIATMIWGWGGTRFGPTNVSRGLNVGALTTLLATVATLIYNNQLMRAANTFRLAGSRQAFRTKSLWSVSLGCPTVHPRPLILDSRVKATIDLVHPPFFPGAGGTWTANMYFAYVQSLESTAPLLQPAAANVDSEKLEWLLFDRPTNHPTCTEPCFWTWLQAGGATHPPLRMPPPAGPS